MMNKRVLKSAGLILLFVLALALLSACSEGEKQKYESAQSLMAQRKYAQAAEKFASLGSYEDASRLAIYCKAAAAGESGDYATCFRGFENLGDYRDSVMMLAYYEARQYQDGGWYDKLLAAGMYEKNILFLDSKERAEACRKTVWDEAMDLRKRGAILSAIERLEVLGSYRGAAGEIPALWYEQGKNLRNLGEWNEAVEAFRRAGTYQDAAEQIKATRYAEGQAMMTAQLWEQAEWALGEIMDYSDAAEKCRKARYSRAEAEETAGNQRKASLLFAGLGDYADAAERAWKPYYEEGLALREAGDYDGAVTAFQMASDTSNPRIVFPSSRTAGDRQIQDAVSTLDSTGTGRAGAAAEIPATRYAKAEALEAAGDRSGAERIFVSLGDYADAKARAYQPHYDEGVALRLAGDWEGAVKAFAQAKDYSDAAEQIKATRYAQGEALRLAGDWDSAVKAFEQAKDYGDAAAQISETRYQQANLLRDEGRPAEAYALYQTLKHYKDVDSLLSDMYTYEYATARGLWGDISVTLTLTDGVIAEMQVDASCEHEVFGQKCEKEEFTGRFIGKRGPFTLGTDIDVLTGATITSNAVVKAVNSIYDRLNPTDEPAEAIETPAASPEPATAAETRSTTVQGFGGEVKVTITLDESGQITEIEVDASKETPNLGQECAEEPFLVQFIGSSGPFVLGENVDAVSTATQTSAAVVEAVNRLLTTGE